MAIAHLGQQVLQRAGYTVAVCTDSREALELFRINPLSYDLVISDMSMPNITGDELAGELMLVRKDIPLIICTGFSERMTEEKAYNMGVKGFLLKPVKKADLMQLVRKVLDEVSG